MTHDPRWPRPVRIAVLLFSLVMLGAYVGLMSCGGASKRSELLPATKAPAEPPMPAQEQAPAPAQIDPRYLGSSKSAPVFLPQDLPAQQAAPAPRAPARK